MYRCVLISCIHNIFCYTQPISVTGIMQFCYGRSGLVSMGSVMSNVVKAVAQLLPLVTFFVTYHFFGIMSATFAIIISSLIAVAMEYYFARTVPALTIMLCVISVILGAATIFTGDAKFIKIKLTIINFAFFMVLMIGVLMQQGWLKYVVGHMVVLEDHHWITLSTRAACFFLFLALLNEVVWRNFSDDVWVKYKVFVAGPLIGVFAVFQVPFVKKFGTVITDDPQPTSSTNDSTEE